MFEAGQGAAYMSQGENMDKVKKLSVVNNEAYMNKIGRPGAFGAMEDAKMVDEGALTSVQYYNKLQDDDAEGK
ncbi:hypothetical protein M3210_13040 [Oceanobacillus luteolus]|uniref:Uncharacterized protein n=1 Tax=Oceanobacillus luteolus TaxID=1274358 RepID=A0ABW4HV62_9BACI|nr:hypothetical protein [Oceanobacillus luteolus]MCM3741197.1 hypothetical protein [Oceanobacillus luteolus]